MFHPQAPHVSITSLLSRQHTPSPWPVSRGPSPVTRLPSRAPGGGICRKTDLPNCWQCHFLETTLMAEDLSSKRALLHQCLVKCVFVPEEPRYAKKLLK